MKCLPLRGPFHFVGIGGSGMSPLAEMLRAQGHTVTGSDLKVSDVTTRLSSLGIATFKGHAASNVGSARCLVLSSAIHEGNVEFAEGRARGLRMIHRGDLLDAVMSPFSHRVAISGSHGKTTTTAMTIAILEAAGFDPSALVGGTLKTLRSGARIGDGDVFVAEADESDRSFLKLHPTISLVTNVDREHLDTYKDLDDVRASFARFSLGVPSWGRAVVCADDPNAAAIGERDSARVWTYGAAPTADVRGTITLEGGGFPRVRGTGPLGDFEFRLGVFGAMNGLNALGAMSVGMALGIRPAVAALALEGFRGVARRLEWKGRRESVDVWDDYGHHPTEIVATLRALRERNEGRRVVALFQPHRVTRTRALWNEFTEAFANCDELWLADIYPAGEAAEEGVSSERLVAAIVANGRAARHAGSLADARANVLGTLRKNDVFLTLGAGNVVDVGDAFLAGEGAVS